MKLNSMSLPLEYNDALSYYENICYLYKKINEIINNIDVFKMYSPIFKGEYDPTKNYEPLNVVIYNELYYMANMSVPIGCTPDSKIYWTNITKTNWNLGFTCPDFFSGSTDTEKFQNCLNSLENDTENIIILNRDYILEKDITIPIINSNWAKTIIIGVGKTTKISYVKGKFTGNINYNSRPQDGGGITFKNVYFDGNGQDIIFDADKLIRITFDECFFRNVTHIINTTENNRVGYYGGAQEFRFFNCFFGGSVKCVVECYRGLLSSYFFGCNSQAEKFINIKPYSNSLGLGIQSLNVENCSIEGFTENAITIDGVNIGALNIKNNYIETTYDRTILEIKNAIGGCFSFTGNFVAILSKNGSTDVPVILIDNKADVKFLCESNNVQGNCTLLETKSVTNGTKFTNVSIRLNSGNVEKNKKIADNAKCIPLCDSIPKMYLDSTYNCFIPFPMAGKIISYPVQRSINIDTTPVCHVSSYVTTQGVTKTVNFDMTLLNRIIPTWIVPDSNWSSDMSGATFNVIFSIKS